MTSSQFLWINGVFPLFLAQLQNAGFFFAAQMPQCAIASQTCRALLEVCGKMLKKSFFCFKPKMLLVRWSGKHTKHGNLLCPNGQHDKKGGSEREELIKKKTPVLLRCQERVGGGICCFCFSCQTEYARSQFDSHSAHDGYSSRDTQCHASKATFHAVHLWCSWFLNECSSLAKC